MDSKEQTALNDALDRMWTQFLPKMEERVTLLESAAAAFAAGRLSAEQRQAASAAAHKLAGVLGSFGLARGTELARELEVLYSAENEIDPGVGLRLISIAAELRSLVESRK
ncbi:MAG: Hpt domain-containing protein [Terracidiphilus sp.]|jgi:HPt (histidine-containing phosphotransfer) domain-containing protein